MATKIYSEEQLNYFRVCHVATDILPQALRLLFKQEWNNRYKATYGEWKDTPQNGVDFKNGESPINQKRNARLLATMVNGDRAEWDCTMLFYAILYSDSIGHGLNPLIRTNGDVLRTFRNEDFAHMAEGQLSNSDFTITVSRVEKAFRDLGLPTAEIQSLRIQKGFPTDELHNVMTNVQKLTLDLTTKHAQLQDKDNDLHDKDIELQDKATKLQEKYVELQEEKKKSEKKDEELQEERNKLQEKRAKLQEKEAELRENKDVLQNTEEQRKVLEEQLHCNVEPFCVLPPRPPHLIASRGSEVAKITQKLQNLKKADPNSLSYCYVSGNPGSGKSQLAGIVAENFYKDVIKDASAPSFVMTLGAETTEALLTSYLSLARKMSCPEYTITTAENSNVLKAEEKIAIIKDLISKKIGLYSSWLLVIDNVSNVADIGHLLPQRGNEKWGKGQLLITTQDCSCIPPDSAFTSQISISKGMEPSDAISLLIDLSGNTDNDMAGKVAHALDYQPLALASAGVYVRKVRNTNPTFGWKKYLQKLEEGKRELTEKELSGINPFYPFSMTVATRIAVKTIMDSDEIMKCAFTFLAFCALEPLKLGILTNYILNVNQTLDKEEIEIQIQGSSLLLIENEDGVNIRLHKVVHDSVKLLVNEGVNSPAHVNAIYFAIKSHSNFVTKAMPDSWYSFDSVGESRHNVPHLITLTVDIGRMLVDETKLKYFKRTTTDFSWYFHFQVLGRICHLHGEYLSAIEYFNAALKCIEEMREIGGSKSATMSIYDEMAILHHALGDHQEAKKYYERALSIQLSQRFPDDVYVANTYHNMGTLLYAMGNYQQAKEYYDRALSIQLSEPSPDYLSVANSYHSMGTLHLALGNHQQAKELYERTLSIRLNKLGFDHVVVASTYRNMGILQQYAFGDHQHAKKCFESALLIQLKRLGPNHVDVAQTYHSIGILHRVLGDYQQAKEYYEQTLSIRLSKLGSNHVDVASIYHSMANLHHALDDYEQAKDYYARALSIRLNKLGPNHVDVAGTYHNMGNLHFAVGDHLQAKECYESALDIQLNKLGPDHADVASTYHSMGILCYALGDHQQAKKYFGRTLAIQMSKLGPEHVDVASTYHSMGILHRVLGDYQEAKEYYERTLSIRLDKLGPNHGDVASIYHSIGILHYALGDHQQAKECYDRTLSIRLNKLGPEHVDVASTYHNIGNLQYALGDHQQAKECYERALKIQLNKLGPDHVDVASTYQSMGILCYTLGDHQQAKECYEHAMCIGRNKFVSNSEHSDELDIYQKLSTLHSHLGDHQRAKKSYVLDLHAMPLKNIQPNFVASDFKPPFRFRRVQRRVHFRQGMGLSNYDPVQFIQPQILQREEPEQNARSMCIGLNMPGSNSEQADTYQNVSTQDSHLGDHYGSCELDLPMQANKTGPNVIAHDVKPSLFLRRFQRRVHFRQGMGLSHYDPVQFIQPQILQREGPEQNNKKEDVDEYYIDMEEYG